MSTIANRTLIHPPSLSSNLIPTLSQIPFERSFANEAKTERKVYLAEVLSDSIPLILKGP
jgi:hypothetical protein